MALPLDNGGGSEHLSRPTGRISVAFTPAAAAAITTPMAVTASRSASISVSRNHKIITIFLIIIIKSERSECAGRHTTPRTH